MSKSINLHIINKYLSVDIIKNEKNIIVTPNRNNSYIKYNVSIQPKRMYNLIVKSNNVLEIEIICRYSIKKYNNIIKNICVNDDKIFIKIMIKEKTILHRIDIIDTYITDIINIPLFKTTVPYYLNNICDKVYVINLEHNSCRMNRMNDVLTKLQIKYERFDAIDGIKLNNPELGCQMSHVNIIKKAIAENHNIICILEDDTIFYKNFNYVLDNMYKNIPNDWDMIYLGANQCNNWNKVNISNNYYKSYECNGTFAYIIRKRIFTDILSVLDDTSLPIDKKYHIIQRKFNVYTMMPNIVISDVSSSNIRSERNMNIFASCAGWNLDFYDYNKCV